jgi:hypothetical protein
MVSFADVARIVLLKELCSRGIALLRTKRRVALFRFEAPRFPKDVLGFDIPE